MAEVANLSIVIDVLDRFNPELDELLFKLGQVEIAAEQVDPIEINADVDDAELDTLLAKMASMSAMSTGGIGNVNVDADSRGGAVGGGRVQTAQLGRLIRDINAMPRNLMEQMGDLGDMSEEVTENLADMGDNTRGLVDALQDGQLRMADVHNAFAKIVPLLLVLIGAFPALYGALITLAGAAVAAGAALASLTAFGAVGFAAQAGGGDIMEGFSQILDRVQEDFMDAFAPLMDRLAPVFEDALNGLDKLFQQIANEGDALVRLQDAASDFGNWVLQTLPKFLGDLANFVNAVEGALGAVFGAMSFDIFEAMAGFLADVLPQLMIFIGQIRSLIPHLLEMSQGFLTVASAILFATNLILEFVTVGGLLDEQLGVLIATLLTAGYAVLLLRSELLALAAQSLVNAGRAIIRMVSVLASYVGVSGSAISSTLGLAASFRVLAGAIALTGIGALALIFGAVAGQAVKASTEVDKATKSLKEFQRQQDRMTERQNPYMDPNVEEGGRRATGRGGGGNVTVNVEGDADTDDVRTQTHNALYYLERTRRG